MNNSFKLDIRFSTDFTNKHLHVLYHTVAGEWCRDERSFRKSLDEPPLKMHSQSCGAVERVVLPLLAESMRETGTRNWQIFSTSHLNIEIHLNDESTQISWTGGIAGIEISSPDAGDLLAALIDRIKLPRPE